MSPGAALFQNASEIIVTGGGEETLLQYKYNFPLRHEAAFEALESPEFEAILRDLTKKYVSNAFIACLSTKCETLTFRASKTYFDLCSTANDKRDDYVSARSVALLREAVADASATAGAAAPCALPRVPIVGVVGPLGDAYAAGAPALNSAREYHRTQVVALAAAGVDAVGVYTLTNSAEAAAVALEADAAGAMCIVLFTLESDDRTACGESLGAAVEEVDRLVAEAGAEPVLYFGVNCIYPLAMQRVLREGALKGEEWVSRVKEFRGNASKLCHEELGNSDTIDEGDPKEWARNMMALRDEFPSLQIIGGCCGTGPKHQEELIKLIKKSGKV